MIQPLDAGVFLQLALVPGSFWQQLHQKASSDYQWLLAHCLVSKFNKKVHVWLPVCSFASLPLSHALKLNTSLLQSRHISAHLVQVNQPTCLHFKLHCSSFVLPCRLLNATHLLHISTSHKSLHTSLNLIFVITNIYTLRGPVLFPISVLISFKLSNSMADFEHH